LHPSPINERNADEDQGAALSDEVGFATAAWHFGQEPSNLGGIRVLHFGHVIIFISRFLDHPLEGFRVAFTIKKILSILKILKISVQKKDLDPLFPRSSASNKAFGFHPHSSAEQCF
jgi:hypothetical protein